MPGPLPGVPDVPALSHMTVQEMIDASPLGPILDRTVADVLGGLGLPPLPVLPPLPPMPGLPPMQPPDLDMFIKPITDLLGGFGSGDLSGAGFDPTIIFDSLTKVLETSMTMGQSALKLADQLWAGQGAVGAATKTAEAGTNSTALAAQGSGISIDTKMAAAIVAKGLAVVQGIVAATVAKISALVPVIMSPAIAVGLSTAAVVAGAGLELATAAVAVTRAELLAPTTAMTANGAPVAITGAPTAGAGQSPFALAGSVLDVVSPAVSTATELPSTLMQPISKMLSVNPDSAIVAPAGSPLTKAKGAGGGGGGGGGIAGVMTPLSASRPTVPTGFGGGEPSLGSSAAPRVSTTPAAMPMGGAPMGAAGAGARGAGASEGQHSVPDYLVTEDNGRAVVGDDPEVAPAVIGHEEAAEADSGPDIELRLGVPGLTRNEEA
ncbi:hypothetical protein V525_11350 [Gordonia alkanivorans CGMCC 6845]|uniref:Uncharacterized protein n=1 Tax=Gordonia alkanivorans CGMCC 6845 TaxID=1423140 RepID=W9DJU4_9ACTN|nr:hypothetical protein V525_11350 [Gordonia alkanivorans CGMCC 6845]